MATPLPVNHARFTLAEVAEATGGRVVGDPSLQVLGVFTDSRLPQPEGIFVALEGQQFDGHRFAESVEARAVIVRREDVAVDRPRVIVDDTIEALGAVAQFHRIRWGGPVVAITGSVGKTTTREFVQTALVATGRRVCATAGNLNNLVGLPLCLLCLDADHEVGVFEIGTSEPGEIEALAGICLPNVGVITAIGVAHSEGLGDVHAIAEEKTSLLDALDGEDAAVLAGDDPMLQSVATEARVFRYGVTEVAEERIGARELVFDADKGEYRRQMTLISDQGELQLSMKRVGRGASLGAAAAITVLRALGELGILSGDRFEAARAIEDMDATAGRMRLLSAPGGALIVDDCYNSSPAAVKSGLRDASDLGDMRGGAKVAVLGDMLELGELEKESHSRVVECAQEFGFEILGVGARMTEACGGAATCVADAAAAVEALAARALGERDVVFVKGSRSVGLEAVVAALWGNGARETAEKGEQA